MFTECWKSLKLQTVVIFYQKISSLQFKVANDDNVVDGNDDFRYNDDDEFVDNDSKE